MGVKKKVMCDVCPAQFTIGIELIRCLSFSVASHLSQFALTTVVSLGIHER